MWPLLGCSLVALAVVLERVAVFAWNSESLHDLQALLESLVSGGRFQEARQVVAARKGLLSRVADAYLANVHRPDSIRDEIASRTAAEQLGRLEKRLNWLSMLGQLAPMLGLLGTVTGLITAFHEIELNQGQVAPDDLAAGIWEALLTTVFGLVIALPVLAVYGLLEHRVGQIGLKMQLLVSYLNDWRDAGLTDAEEAVTDSAAKARKPDKGRAKDAGIEAVGAGR